MSHQKMQKAVHSYKKNFFKFEKKIVKTKSNISYH